MKSFFLVPVILFAISFASCKDTAASTDYGSTLTEAPVCMYVGTAEEGWYYADAASTPLRIVACDGDTAECLYDRERTEGWYAASDGSYIDYIDCRQ